MGKSVTSIKVDENERIKKAIDAGAEFVKAILPFAMDAVKKPEPAVTVRKRKKKKKSSDIVKPKTKKIKSQSDSNVPPVIPPKA